MKDKKASLLAIAAALALILCMAVGFIIGAVAKDNDSFIQINEDGTMTEVEGIKIEGNLLVNEIATLEAEIDSLLWALDYIEDSEVTLFYRSKNTGTLCFQAYLLGENLEEHLGEISGMIKEELSSCNLEHLSIVDIVGAIYPAPMISARDVKDEEGQVLFGLCKSLVKIF